MIKKEYSIRIKAPASKVYRTMLGLDDKSTYEKWTARFHPTSTYEGSWNKGSRIHFIATDDDGKKQGMVSEIADNIPGKFVSIRHIGVLDGDKEVLSGPEVEKWAGGMENYSFEEEEGSTTVYITVDITEEYVDFFEKTWPASLEILKRIAE